ncbi:NADAR family protein [Sulfurovum indicum]|uniref:NADAR family protein n=2 Tax=Sulfurovaceae TaxID=2771472 RepID=A0A7M1S690_9BACT|nr:NADAR family protein [Sulfurovum indicum]
MVSGYPLVVNNTFFLSSEALYQCCRFPHLPDVQKKIIEQTSPMTAKMVSKPFRHQSRLDWDMHRIKIMKWCIRVKLAQNWDRFSKVLLSTNSLAIVEDSHKDEFWGAKFNGETFVGVNALGRLLMELREEIKNKPKEEFRQVPPPMINDFLLFRKQIGIVTETDKKIFLENSNIYQQKNLFG